MKTYSTKPTDVKDHWHVIDAEGQVLGRVASAAAQLLRGKHKPIFSPSVDTGDHVIIINAEKIAVTNERKMTDKLYYRHSGYPGGLKTISLGEQLEKHPERVIQSAVWGMLPKTKMGRKQMKKLRVFVGVQHCHEAQQPQPYEIKR